VVAVSYVGIDTQGARALGQALQDTAGRIDGVRRDVTVALDLADLASQVPAQLAQVHDGVTVLGAGVTDKATLAEQYALDPVGTAARLGAPVDVLGVAISGLLGFAGPADLRGVLVGLPAPGADPALDGALARLNPVLLPAFKAGQRPELAELTEAQAADLKLLALALGIAHAGPPVLPEPVAAEEGRGFFARLRSRTQERTGTEVFWNDFWAGGRTVDSVLADPALLLEWVAGTFELDRRLALATGLPTLGDVLTSVDFGTTGSDPGDLAAMLAAAEAEFAAIAGWLPAFLVGQDRTGPDATQLAQTLAFAARVGWPDPGAAAAGEPARLADAIAFLRANRALQSALLPTGFEGDADPLAFFNAPGIGFVLDLGHRTGVLDAAVLATIAATVDQALAAFGVDLSGPTPAVLTEQLQQQLFALLSTQIPRSALEKPAFQAQFIAALGFLRSAATGPEQRQRLVDVLAAFRTLAVTGAPALTERQLVAAVGQQVLDVLGRGRLRARSQDAVRKNPEFLLVARQWGLPGGRKEEIGKYKFSWSFNDLGELTAIRRKKKSWLSRAWDTIKAVGNAIWESWEDNPLKAIFQIGKIALGALAFVVPGFQGLGAAALAVNLAETAFHAIEGDWLAAIGSGLAAFTAGASDIFGAGLPTVVETAQGEFVKGLLDSDALSFLKNAKRAFDIGSSIFRATQADSLIGAIGAGLGAAATTIGSGGQLLGNLDLIDGALARDLTRLGLTVADLTRFVTPIAGLAGGGSVLSAFGNGLALIAAGARVVANPAGAFAGQNPLGGAVFQFDQQTRDALRDISAGAGAAAGVARAIEAADRGDTFLAGTFLAQAVQALNDPRTTDTGLKSQAAERVAEIGILLEAVFERRASATAVAPLVIQRLTAVLDALNTKLPQPGQQVPPLPEPNPARVPGPAPLVSALLTPGAGPAPAEGGPVTDTFSVVTVAEAEGEFAPAAGDGDVLAGGDGNVVLVGGAGTDLLPPTLMEESRPAPPVPAPVDLMPGLQSWQPLPSQPYYFPPTLMEESRLGPPIAAPVELAPGLPRWEPPPPTVSPFLFPPTLMQESPVEPQMPSWFSPYPTYLDPPEIAGIPRLGPPELMLPVPPAPTVPRATEYTLGMGPLLGPFGGEVAVAFGPRLTDFRFTGFGGVYTGFLLSAESAPSRTAGITGEAKVFFNIGPVAKGLAGVSGNLDEAFVQGRVQVGPGIAGGRLKLYPEMEPDYRYGTQVGTPVPSPGIGAVVGAGVRVTTPTYNLYDMLTGANSEPVEWPTYFPPTLMEESRVDPPILPPIDLVPGVQSWDPSRPPYYLPPTLMEESRLGPPIPEPVDLMPGVQSWQPSQPWQSPYYVPPTLMEEEQWLPPIPAPVDLMPGVQSWQPLPSLESGDYLAPIPMEEFQIDPSFSDW
jgi:hypothetical protein